MRLANISSVLILFSITGRLVAGPEIYDPMETYKGTNALNSRPKAEIVSVGNLTEMAKFQYEGNLLIRADYFGARNIPDGYSLYDYERGRLVRERLFDSSGAAVEQIEYAYRKDKLIKSMIHDIRGDAKIEWHYSYDKSGNLASGRRIIGRRATESFKIKSAPTGKLQQIYNTKGELTSQVNSFYEGGLLRHRVKTGLTGTQYADYRYDDKNQLIEIIFHETLKGEKKLVKKHQFEYSYQSTIPKTAMK
jgi:hypothetical protein